MLLISDIFFLNNLLQDSSPDFLVLSETRLLRNWVLHTSHSTSTLRLGLELSLIVQITQVIIPSDKTPPP